MSFVAFNSRDINYKSVFGCVKTQESFTLRVRLPRSFNADGVFTVLKADGADSEETAMKWLRADGDTELWTVDICISTPGLYFYHFRFSSPSGGGLILRYDMGLGTMTNEGEPWQLTVYEAAFTTPRWLRGGIIYQIFPDRFCFSGVKKRNVPDDRVMHKYWSDTPEWRPDEHGEIRNNDFFGGDLRGIACKLPYLASLGVTCIYLNPIFESCSNHRYDTADYMKIDPLLGTQEDFVSLCAKAEALGIRIILDGVFNHTGADSVYFNKNGRYPGPGAYQSKDSPFYSWYRFRHFNDKYDCWWDFPTLPDVNEDDPGFSGFITGSGGVIDKWITAGASGFRLDVADELPDNFIVRIRSAVKHARADGLLLGEVWEDASSKVSYGERRRYLQGYELDSVMNYPFREAIITFLTGGTAEDFMEKIVRITENYPREVLNVLMNPLGTHDTERILSILGGIDAGDKTRQEQSRLHLDAVQRDRALHLLRLAAVIQYTLPGVPSLYYGDEAGTEGMKDPFNRSTFPWGQEDRSLTDFFARIGRFRRSCLCVERRRV